MWFIPRPGGTTAGRQGSITRAGSSEPARCLGSSPRIRCVPGGPARDTRETRHFGDADIKGPAPLRIAFTCPARCQMDTLDAALFVPGEDIRNVTPYRFRDGLWPAQLDLRRRRSVHVVNARAGRRDQASEGGAAHRGAVPDAGTGLQALAR